MKQEKVRGRKYCQFGIFPGVTVARVFPAYAFVLITVCPGGRARTRDRAGAPGGSSPPPLPDLLSLGPGPWRRPAQAVGVWLPLSGPYLGPLSSMTRSRPGGHACLQRAGAISVTCRNPGVSSCFLTTERTPPDRRPAPPPPASGGSRVQAPPLLTEIATLISAADKSIDEFPLRKVPPPTLPSVITRSPPHLGGTLGLTGPGFLSHGLKIVTIPTSATWKSCCGHKPLEKPVSKNSCQNVLAPHLGKGRKDRSLVFTQLYVPKSDRGAAQYKGIGFDWTRLGWKIAELGSRLQTIHHPFPPLPGREPWAG